MSKAGCPYDNAPMERFYNTFKSNFYNITSFSNVEMMDELTMKYINWYNYVRPHSYNNYLTPMEARYRQIFIEQSVTKKLDHNKPSTAGRNSLPIIIVSNPGRKPEKQYKTKEDDTMEEFITDERTGLRYELVGDYYLIAGEDEPEGRPIGIWGQRHLRYIRSAAMEIVSSELIYC